MSTPSSLLTASSIRALADRLGVRPTKTWGQNFVVDANTVTKIVRLGQVGPHDHVVEVGPGLGSLTLGLLAQAEQVTAIEIDPTLAAALPETVAELAPTLAAKLAVVHADALSVRELPAGEPTALVANLPYNVSVPVVLHFLENFPSLQRVLVMVQAEVGERLAAKPGSKIYGVPSVKAAWYSDAAVVAQVPRSVFWPVPNVDSVLVALERRDPPQSSVPREQVFATIDAAFAQRRKTLRAALGSLFGSPQQAEEALRAAGIDPRTRGEQLGILEFTRIAQGLQSPSQPPAPDA